MSSSATLRGGVANGHSFTGLSRTPTFVRLVQAKNGTLDLLNDLDDEVRPGERVVGVYVLDMTSRVHVCARGRGATGGWWVTYYDLPIVGVDELRTEDAWCSRLDTIVGVSAGYARAERDRLRADAAAT